MRAQTVDLGVNQTPTVLLVVPATGASGVEPLWWWDSRLGASSLSDAITGFGRPWPQAGRFHVVHPASGKSYNANGVSYKVIALFDPSGRYVIPFAVSKGASEDHYTQYLRYPESGELASDFTPDFVFGGVANGVTADSVRSALYGGPGHVGDLTAKLGLTTAQASDAGRIQALGAGTVQVGTTVGYGTTGTGDSPF